MKQLKIKLNGRVIETIKTNRNDLRNSFSPKHHSPARPEMQRPFYKSLFENQLATNKGLLITLGITILTASFTFIGMDIRYRTQKAELEALNRLRTEELTHVVAMVDEYNELLAEYASMSAKLPQPKTFKGKVSYYDHLGCLGCSPNQITASGEPFDENKYTMAIPVEWKHIKMGTMMTVTNLDNGKTITVKANDRGGFLKYNRVADLSKAAYIDLGAKTDISTLEFTWR